MRKLLRLMLVASIIFILLSGCSADMVGRKIGEQIKLQTEPTVNLSKQTISPSCSTLGDDFDSSNSDSFPIAFLHSHAGDGAIHVSVDSAYVIRNLNDLPASGGFLEDFASVYGKTIDSPVLYEYPDMFCQDGSMQGGVFMVLLDVTVSNPDGATSRYRSANGKWVNHYNDPYMFRAYELCELLSKESITGYGIRASYFSRKNEITEEDSGFILNYGEEKNFQLGFLIGYEVSIEDNQLNSIQILPEDILLCAVSPDKSTDTWELHLS